MCSRENLNQSEPSIRACGVTLFWVWQALSWHDKAFVRFEQFILLCCLITMVKIRLSMSMISIAICHLCSEWKSYRLRIALWWHMTAKGERTFKFGSLVLAFYEWHLCRWAPGRVPNRTFHLCMWCYSLLGLTGIVVTGHSFYCLWTIHTLGFSHYNGEESSQHEYNNHCNVLFVLKVEVLYLSFA